MRFGITVLMCSLFVPQVQAQSTPICTIADDVQKNADTFASKPAVKTDGINLVYGRFRREVIELCEDEPTDAELRSGEAIFWVASADMTGERIADGIFENLLPPQTPSTLNRLRLLANWSGKLQAFLRTPRAKAYHAVRVETKVETKEKVVHVEVPAPCPDPGAQCAEALRYGADQWASQLDEWTSRYQGGGDDWKFAKSSIPSLRSIGISGARPDPLPVVIGWLAQYRHVTRHGSQSFLGSGPLSRIAADMRAQLGMCGVIQPDYDRQ